MDAVRINSRGSPAPDIARRPTASWAARLACGAALTAALIGFGWTQPAVAQDDDEIVHTAGGATLIVSPGNASAISAVAEAHAEPGFAHTKGAAAEAIADCEDGALTRGAAALAVAHPDEGALAESAVTEIDAKDDEDKISRSARSSRRSATRTRRKRRKRRSRSPPEPAPAPEPVEELPVTGAGGFASQPLAPLLWRGRGCGCGRGRGCGESSDRAALCVGSLDWTSCGRNRAG